jgi:hypothetical protein
MQMVNNDCRKRSVCTSPKRLGCTVKTMQNELRHVQPRIPNLWKMQKSEICAAYEDFHRRNDQANARPTRQAPTSGPRPINQPKNQQAQPNARPTSAPSADPGFIWKPTTRYLSGPVSMAVFEVGDGKHVYLFGDQHNTKLGRCWRKADSEYIVDVLQRLCQEEKGDRDVDVFLETPLSERWYEFLRTHRRGWTASPLFEAIVKFADDAYHTQSPKRCKYVRFHRVDPRHDIVFEMLHPRVVERIQHTLVDIEKFVMAFAFGSYDDVVSLPTLRSLGLKISVRKGSRSPISKEISRLDERFIPLLKRHTRQFISQCLGDTKSIVNVTENVAVLLMDLYALARLLRYVQMQKRNSVSIVFAGDAHISSYIAVLASLFGDPIRHHARTHPTFGFQSKLGWVHRCMDVNAKESVAGIRAYKFVLTR